MSESTETTGSQQTKDAIALLVGPDKKFKTVEELAYGKLEADNFIKTLIQEKKDLEARYEELNGKRGEEATIAELVKTLRESQKGNGSDGTETLSDAELTERVRSIMEGENAAKTRQRNRDEGMKLVLQKVQGNAEAADTYLASKAKELGISKDALLKMSEESPTGFAKLVDALPKQGSHQSTTAIPGVNTQALGADAPIFEIDGHKTKAWYDQKKKEMGLNKYLANSSIQGGYLKDALALGDRFSNPQR